MLVSNRKKFYKQFAIFLLFFLFLIFTGISYRDLFLSNIDKANHFQTLTTNSLDQEIISTNNIETAFTFKVFSKNLFKDYRFLFSYIFLHVPLIGITIYELFCNKITTGGFIFSKTSIYKIKKSKGWKYADIWYQIIPTISSKIPYLLPIASLGFLTFFSKFNDWLSSIYESTMLFTGSGFIIFCFAILWIDFMRYVNHRMIHHPFFFPLHEFHHSATEMTILSRDRVTILEDILTSFLLAPLMLPASLIIANYISNSSQISIFFYIFYMAVAEFNAELGHSSSLIIYPKPISNIIMSPSLHWLHHSDNVNHYNCNFGSFTPIWDKLFGTYLGEEHIKDISSLGIENTIYNQVHPLKSYFLVPIILLKNNLIRSVKS